MTGKATDVALDVFKPDAREGLREAVEKWRSAAMSEAGAVKW